MPAGVSARPGRDWSAAWTAEVDATITANLARLSPAGGVAVVALGSYARRELCPASDVDVLLLHDGWRNKELQELVRSICYPLWDSGLEVGHAVLTAREAVAAAGEAIDRATSLTDRRLVAGDRGLLDDLATRTQRWLRRSRRTLIEDLAAADRRRHGRDGSVPGMLEPDLKNSAGGLRDVDSLRWAAACLLGEPTLDALIGAGYMAAGEHRDLREAAAALLEARCALHLVLGARKPRHGVDGLRLEVQDDVAAYLGDASGHDVLRRVGLAMRVIRHVSARAWPQLLDDARGGRKRRRGRAIVPVDDDLLLVDGVVETVPGTSVAADPSLPLRTVAAAAAHHTSVGRATGAALRREILESRPLAWTDASRRALLALLADGDRALAAFADADHLGIFDAMLPEWSRVRGHPQRNPYHRFDLDTHLIRTVAECVAVMDGAVDPRHAAIAERLGAPEVVLLAAFLHDVGKPWPGDHSHVGADIAGQWVRHMGFAPTTAARVARLVRHHLLLPEVATTRDLDDPAELEEVAKAVEDSETLDGLLLLSLADARATGPSAYSGWKDNLLNEVHARVRTRLDGQTGGAHVAEPGLVATDARRRVGDHAVDRLLKGLDHRYLLAADAEQVSVHAELAASGTDQLRASWRNGRAPNTAVVTVTAPDRRGLVADCAGVLAGYGLPVHEARAFTRADGVALDWFVVGTHDPVTGARAQPHAVVDALHRLGRGALDVVDLLGRRERRRDVRVLARPTDVEVAISVSARMSRVDVRSPDVPGILYRLARVLADAGLSVVGARVATLEGEARDVFFVTGLDPSTVDELRAALRTAADLAGSAAAGLPTAPRPRSSA